MTHRIILVSHDFKVLKVVVARRKHAGVAQVTEQRIRIPQGEVLSASTSPSLESE